MSIPDMGHLSCSKFNSDAADSAGDGEGVAAAAYDLPIRDGFSPDGDGAKALLRGEGVVLLASCQVHFHGAHTAVQGAVTGEAAGKVQGANPQLQMEVVKGGVFQGDFPGAPFQLAGVQDSQPIELAPPRPAHTPAAP